MRNEPNRKMIGLFMASGLAVLIIIFGLFVKSKFFAGDAKSSSCILKSPSTV